MDKINHLSGLESIGESLFEFFECCPTTEFISAQAAKVHPKQKFKEFQKKNYKRKKQHYKVKFLKLTNQIENFKL